MQRTVLGKRVVQRIYAHVLLFDELPEEDRRRIGVAAELANLTPGTHFHVARIDVARDEVALLSYPMFFDEPFPSLSASWRVHLPTASVYFRDYSNSLNPPILHRKELMLPGSHPDQERLRELTRVAEEIGLFDDPVRIGFRSQWLELVASKGYAVSGQRLMPLGNDYAGEWITSSEAMLRTPVQRHLTALSRNFLSAPVQALLRHGLLREGRRFFDYGCGKGGDIEGARSLGFEAEGWDPYFRPEADRSPADVVNLGFVINVIERLEERIEALQCAFGLADGVLSVAAMLWASSQSRGQPYGDGFLTTRNTFQKYYSQTELQAFIEGVLDEQAIPVGPGVFFVFRDRYLEQQFLSGRQSDASRAPRLLARQRVRSLRPQAPLDCMPQHESDPKLSEAAERIRLAALDFGRFPEQNEYSGSDEAIRLFGSWRRALHAASRGIDQALLQKAADARADEVRAFFAAQLFSERKRLRDLEPRLRRDVKTFFGSLAVAEAEGLRLLRECANVETIRDCCRAAASEGLGWLDADHSLQLHSSLIPRLPPALRVFIGCATALYGDALGADLVKIHIQSGKVTLMRFDDFVNAPLPRMHERVKVRLRDQELDYFSYGEEFTPPFLYFKSRYINEEFPRYAEQLAFDRELELLGFKLVGEHGPEPNQFVRWLDSQRREVQGMRLEPSTRIPRLDEPCGAHLTFRHLCECGETWERVRPDNVPKSPATYNALFELATKVLDPVIDYFGGIKITYGFSSKRLTREIKRGIAPKLDQHAACELGRNETRVCQRGGAAVDFLVEYENMHEVVCWIAAHCEFDRMYFYGVDRPIHVSVGPECAKEVFELVEARGKRTPRRMDV